MKKTLALVLLFATVLAKAQEYKNIESKVLGLSLAEDASVIVHLKPIEDEPVTICHSEDPIFEFQLDSIISQKWFDLLILAKNSGREVGMTYKGIPDSNNMCSVTKVSFPVPTDDPDSIGGEDGVLTETGMHGNIALVGTNGLTGASYSASGSYRQDIPAAAFDGHTFDEKVNEDAEDKIGRGLWLVKRDKKNPQPVWLQADFGQKIKFGGLMVMLNEQATSLGRGPRDIEVLVSNDGETFALHESFRLAAYHIQSVPFQRPITARYIRVKIKNNQGDPNFIEIDELEIYQFK